MRKLISVIPALFLLAALATPTIVRADDITYIYDINNGPITVSGTLVTDGTLGVINPCNSFIAGTATITDNTHNITSTLASPNVACNQVGPSAWTATTSSILFDFNDPTSSTEFLGLPLPILVFTSNPDPGEIELTDSNGQTNVESRSGFLAIATVPEPGTRSLLLTGLGLIGLMVMTRKRA